MLLEMARNRGAIVTAEEHLQTGGLSSAVCQVLASEYPVPVDQVCLQDEYAESGDPMALLERYGLTYPSIVEAALRAVARKAS